MKYYLGLLAAALIIQFGGSAMADNAEVESADANLYRVWHVCTYGYQRCEHTAKSTCKQGAQDEARRLCEAEHGYYACSYRGCYEKWD